MDLTGDRIEIRNFKENDFDTFYKLTKDADNHNLAGLEYAEDIHKSKNIFNKYLVLANTYVIALKSSHRMLGIIELNERGISNGLDKTREIGFVISKEFRGHGYATEAIQVLLDYSFKILHLSEVWASVKVDNMAPQSILTKMGFKYIYQVSQDPLHLEDSENVLKYYLLKNTQQGN
ncbi:GNAT family N-acetyltransferase [Companilactobacillus sp.]|jgi:RimJ/RimL family protein N-acetyltransferase|uniref:GNAT family N-acetyltransferase n=1 Tax=Companilactobacillus sp. TaxID=2767905 RepID=UPI0025C6DA6C|nr:GNAT family N-acetyltransferase [Companilactobacillus sp.]MCH4008972.1 GNAT family N-acetyltransferase [Companilactobacillus sp.]MCH4050849.1 GNAT family N-acetyltransferase [Companilactobacillus sp.]MCH4076915.1 GNAT family N-acetyltransferase [Companilactobacillus sp.]MCH4125490.1 GNAT family N-acetyltransferase [Companilactobacillus sp.]MCI1311199.1 GNAT family N-acetyltransferase [Companilactobacillus sp.]